MPNKIILCFDGTSNEPSDAVQDESHGEIEDSGITNVLKLHLLFGGDLKDGRRFDDQQSLYYSGVGTYGSKVKRAFNAALAPENKDVGRIIREAAGDLRRTYRDGDEVSIFGFSRGAAIARRFASVLGQFFDGAPPPIRFAGLFDTVASIGKPNLSDTRKPVSDVFFENQTISPLIGEALHLVSLDDRRKAFWPTLMNQDDRVTEVWFAGVHCDVGGGYYRDGLSDVALRYMMDELDRRGVGLKRLAATDVRYDDLGDEDGEDDLIDLDDVLIEPDVLGRYHAQRRRLIARKLTLGTRHLRVNVNDRQSDGVPLVHASVAERIVRDEEYRPAALKGRRHRMIGAAGLGEEMAGLRTHLALDLAPFRPLLPEQSHEFVVHAYKPSNPSGVLVKRGEEYWFEVDLAQRWRDGGIECGPEGWTREDVSLGLKEVGIKAVEWMRRQPDADWFELVGGIGDDDDEPVRVLQHTTPDRPFVPRRSGEFTAFANDLKRAYRNNDGFLRLTIHRKG